MELELGQMHRQRQLDALGLDVLNIGYLIAVNVFVLSLKI